MKNKLIIFLSIFILSACDILESKPDCSAILCDFVSRSIKIKYLDKSTNKPLFAQGSSFTLSDLKVSRTTNSNYETQVKFDSSDPAIIIVTPLVGDEVLTLGNMSSDKITMKLGARGKECCSPLEVLSLKINDETICAPCNNLNETIVVIKK